MSFDIYQKIFDEDGEVLEDKIGEYQVQLLDLFAESPEGLKLLETGQQFEWSNVMLDFAFNYEGVTVTLLEPEELETILLEHFPRKVSTQADQAPAIIKELQAFFRFLGREYKLENAQLCLEFLENKTTLPRFKKEMSNPANFGMAKSMVMEGMDQGYDMTTDEGINQWMSVYKAANILGNLPGLPGLDGPKAASSLTTNVNKNRQKEKARRKIAKASRRKNRH